MTDRPLQLGIVINFVPTDPPGRWLGEYLPESDYVLDLLRATPDDHSFWARHHWLPPYVGEFLHLARRGTSLDRYDVIFTWELRTTLATALLRRLRGQRRAHLVALCPVVKGLPRTMLPAIRRLMQDADRIVYFSSTECVRNASVLRLPTSRLQFVPRFSQPAGGCASNDSIKDFIMVLGHSNRDFPALWRALDGTELRATMYRNLWTRGRELPNVTLIPRVLAAADEADLVAAAAFHVLPLKPATYSSGLTVLLRAMAHGKAVIVSDVTGIKDYVRDGETAVIVPAGDPAALRAAMLRLWHDRDERERIGRNAAREVRERFSSARFAAELAAIAVELMRSA